MIRGEAMREKIKSLWKLCFNDSDEFTDMYFRLRYSNEVNIAIQSGEEVIAALQILPYPMTFGKSEIKTGYVSGAGNSSQWFCSRCPGRLHNVRRLH